MNLIKLTLQTKNFNLSINLIIILFISFKKLLTCYLLGNFKFQKKKKKKKKKSETIIF